MIDRIDSKSVDQLAERTDGPWISIYLPTERAGPNTSAKTQFKNLMAEAVTTLEARGTKPRGVTSFAERGTVLLGDKSFWATQHNGLAVFLSPTDLTTFRLTDSCQPEVTVTASPEVEVLRSQADRNQPFAVLALSLQHVRLLRGDQQTLVEDDPAVLPVSLDEALGLDDRERQLQSHAGGRVGSGNVTASFHGQGSDNQADADRFLRLVDQALGRAVAPDVPIVLAGVDRLVTAFRHVARSNSLVDEAIHGNVDRTSATSLHERAWAILQRA